MAPRGSETPRWALFPATAALLVPLLLLSSLPLTDASAGSPSPAPAPAPAPLHHAPPPRPQHAAPGSTKTPPPGHRSARHPTGAATPSGRSAWQRLNFGERFGIGVAGVAAAMQVALGAFLCVRARQLRRAAAARKDEEQQEEPGASPTQV